MLYIHYAVAPVVPVVIPLAIDRDFMVTFESGSENVEL